MTWMTKNLTVYRDREDFADASWSVETLQLVATQYE